MAPVAFQSDDATRDPLNHETHESGEPSVESLAVQSPGPVRVIPPESFGELVGPASPDFALDTATSSVGQMVSNGANGANGVEDSPTTTVHESTESAETKATKDTKDSSSEDTKADRSAPADAQNELDGVPIPKEPKYPPVAIIGLSCRLPGDVSDPEAFYQLCCRARSGWTEIPEDRFSKSGYHHPNPDKLGCYNPAGGCFLTQDVAAFDAPFFNITEREAISMDPQHRLILECTYEALENAGIPKHKIVGQNVGVYAGGSFTDYELNNLRDLDTAPMYQSTGNAPSLMSNRISYYFDLRGPSHTVETACSSSLTALHIAMQSMKDGDSSMVILASSHLNLLPDHFVSMSSQGLLSGDGRSYAFDSRANGFGRGEGAGALILKPLDAAQRDNDNIRAVIVGTGVNQDGRTNGITMPNGEAQFDLMKRVYEEAGIDPVDCGYVEAHGTGTKVGDPLEMRAIHNMFHEGRTKRRPLYVGSVKTNVGHLEGASGIVSMIKATMMLERGYILPNHDFQKGNPEIPFDDWGIKVPTKLMPWPRGKKYISINSFGFGGGNAHAVLAAPPKNNVTDWAPEGYVEPRRLYVVSGHTKESLLEQMTKVNIYLEGRPVAFQIDLLTNLAYTLGQRRSFLPYKVAISSIEGKDLSRALVLPPANPIRSTREPTIGFVFTGQGAQWHAMGRELISSYPVFRESIERFDATLLSLGAPFSLMDELHKDAETSRLNDAELSQPGCTAIQLAMTDLLRAWGINPNAVVGHSSGEIGAAYAARALTLEECAAIAYFRGQSVLQLKSSYPDLQGGMLAVGASPADIWPIIKMLKTGRATVACINSPGSITASGDTEAITELQSKIEEKQLFNRRVRVETAYHSHHMELVADWYRQSVGELLPLEGSTVAFYSSLRGHLINSSELDTSYWVQNLTQPVQFSQALTEMCKPKDGFENIDVLVEIGPHSALEGPVKQIVKAIDGLTKKPVYFPSLVRKKDSIETAQNLAGNLFTYGTLIDLEAINFPVPPPKQLRVLWDMPKYSWNHSTKYWWESRISHNHLHRPFPRNDVSGVLADYSNELEPVWRNIIRPDEQPWVRGHVMQEMPIYPMAGYLSMAVEAIAQRAQLTGQTFDRFVFRDVTISRPLVVQESIDTETNITLRPYSEGTKNSSKVWDEFRVFSWNKDRKWLEHCRGLIRVENSADTNPVYDGVADAKSSLEERIAKVVAGCNEPVDPKALYAELETVTAKYNTQFQSMENCIGSDTSCIADIVVPNTRKGMPKEHEPSLYIHPAFLDQFTHAAWVILGAGRGRLPALYMPKFFKSLTISRNVCRSPGDRLRVHGIGNPDFTNPGSTNITMFATSMDGSSEMIHMEGLIVDPLLDSQGPGLDSTPRELCFKVGWEDFNPSILETAGQDSAGPVLSDPFVVVSTPPQQALATAIQEALSKSSAADVEIATLDSKELADKVCIVISELEKPILSSLDSDSFENVQRLALKARCLLWVIRGGYSNATNPQLGMVLGLARTVRAENDIRFATLDLDGEHELGNAEVASNIIQIANYILAEGASASIDMEFQERMGKLSVCRVYDDVDLDSFVRQSTSPSSEPFLQPFHQHERPLKLHVGNKGALDTLHFIDDQKAGLPLAADEVSIEVKVTSMNFKDIMVSMGEVPSPYLGVECAGIINAIGSDVTHLKVGDRVCASSEGAYSTYTRCKGTSAARIPDEMSFEDAATIPVVFCTAYYSLFDIGRLEAGESVLIHAAAGGVGQAAIMLCQMVGASFYATVGSIAKKTFLMDRYGVPEDHIFYSRDTSFAAGVMRATDGRGVDVVLNSLAGDVLRATWECVAHFGRFVEIGKRDILGNSGLDMAMFEHNATFASVDLTVVAAERPRVMKRILDDVFMLLQKGAIRPIAPITVFPISNVESAFRTLQSGRAHGKILVSAGPEDQVQATYSEKIFDGLFYGDATYIIVGGTGGIGRSIIPWMVTKGARNIVIVSRSDKISEKIAAIILEAKTRGATVVLRACDITKSEEVSALITNLSKEMPTIRGLVHSAMVLDDVLFEKMTFEQWQKVVQSKVAGCWNMHTALTEATAPLDFFITLSSVAAIIGNRGQAAYAAANCFLDSLVQYRRRLGLPASTLNLAAASDTGYLADNADRQKLVMEQIGGESICEKEIIALIAASVMGKLEETCKSQSISGLKLPANHSNIFWATDAKFTPLVTKAAALLANGAGADSSTQVVSPGTALKRSTSYADAHSIVVDALLDKTAGVLMLPREDLDPTRDTVFYGLDSLVSIEIRNWITREFGTTLQILDLLSSGSFMALADIVLKKTEIVSFEKV